MEKFTTIARPYAKAIFELAQQSNSFEAWQKQLDFFALIAQDPSMKRWILGTQPDEKTFVLLSQVAEGYADTQGLNLLKLLVENKRLQILPELSKAFYELHQVLNQVVDVQVTSASDLSVSQKEATQGALEQRLQKKVLMNCTVDESLIGGLVIKAEDMVIDGSVRSKLTRMSQTLLS